MLKIYDCSNSADRPANRGYGGAVENACVSMLKRYAFCYDSVFVNDPAEADVFFTNDVFPSSLEKIKKPRVKRMDGIFWQNSLLSRNEALNKAALQADYVVFVSDYSRRSLAKLYNIVPVQHEVVLNAVDESFFFIKKKVAKSFPRIWVTSATHWGREEKRFSSIIEFSKIIQEHDGILYLIGNLPSPCELPFNVISLGYIQSMKRIALILRNADAFVNLSYRDASPKSVSEAVCCGLPVLYADSGGTGELVSFGGKIEDRKTIKFEDCTPSLSKTKIFKSYVDFVRTFWVESDTNQFSDGKDVKMLKRYFEIFKEVTK